MALSERIEVRHFHFSAPLDLTTPIICVLPGADKPNRPGTRALGVTLYIVEIRCLFRGSGRCASEFRRYQAMNFGSASCRAPCANWSVMAPFTAPASCSPGPATAFSPTTPRIRRPGLELSPVPEEVFHEAHMIVKEKQQHETERRTVPHMYPETPRQTCSHRCRRYVSQMAIRPRSVSRPAAGCRMLIQVLANGSYLAFELSRLK